MHCLLRCGAVVLVVAALIAGGAVLAARQASSWLSASDTPAAAAAIVVLGDDPTRALAGADLYRAGVAPRVLLTVPLRSPRLQRLEREGVPVAWFEEAGAHVLRRNGVPDAAIGTLGQSLKSTHAEGLALAERFAPGETLVVVTSPYHVRRARMILRDALPGRNVLVVGNRHEALPAAWWTEQEASRNVLLEGLKLGYWFAGGRFR
jgi:uncharacterized SAM-binding protein YcdF (DUF218 family)